MALSPTESAERAFGRAEVAANRAGQHLSANNTQSFNSALAQSIAELTGRLQHLSVAVRQTYAAVDSLRASGTGSGDVRHR